MTLFLYHVSQDVTGDEDTYSDFVVAAPDEDAARRTAPDSYNHWDSDGVLCDPNGRRDPSPGWAKKLDDVKVRLIGVADASVEAGIICKSFHAG